MKIEFDRLTLENFGSFVAPQTIDFGAWSPGVYYVTGQNDVDPDLGPNGVGKSTLLAAVCWCLYGILPDGSRGADLVSWESAGRKGPAAISVMLQFNVDGIAHTLERHTLPTALRLDGKPVEQVDVERLVGMSLSLFKHTVYLAQSQPLFHDLPPREKLDLLTEALGLERWENYSEKAAHLVKQREAEQAVLERELDRLISVGEELLRRRTELEDEHARWKNERSDKIQALGYREAELENRRKKADANVAALEVAAKKREAQLKASKKELDDARQALTAAREAVVEHRTTIASLTHEGERLLGLSKQLKQNANICPTCKQPVKDKTALNAHKKEHEKRRLAVLEQLTELTKQTKHLVEQKDGWALAVETLERAYEELLKGDNALIDAKTELRNIKLELARVRTELKDHVDTKNPYARQLATVQVRLRATDLEHDVKVEALEAYEAGTDAIKFWIKGFKDVRLFILSEVVQELELVTNTMLDSFGLTGWEMRFDVERETKSGTTQRGLVTEVIPSTGQAGVKWQRWSGGESQRLRLIGALALSQVLLSRVGVEVNMEFLDEPVHFVGENGVDDICAYLAERAKEQGRKVVLVDHMALESSMFTGTVRVTKTVEGSKVEVL